MTTSKLYSLGERVLPKGSDLPWWGIGLTTSDASVIRKLLQSSKRLTDLMDSEGWHDVECIVQDWMFRYHEVAESLGQEIKQDETGRVLVSDEDTPQHDRQRLIACAQAAAIKGLMGEIVARAKFSQRLRDRKERDGRTKQPVESDYGLV